MKKNPEKIKPGWWLPVKVKESFADFCSDVGHHIQEDFAGALFIWPYLPAQLREWATLDAKDNPVVKPEFWEGLKKAGLLSTDLTPSENLLRKKDAGH